MHRSAGPRGHPLATGIRGAYTHLPRHVSPDADERNRVCEPIANPSA
jgi:hypothetical protein